MKKLTVLLIIILFSCQVFSQQYGDLKNLKTGTVLNKEDAAALKLKENSSYGNPGFGIRGGIGTDISGGIGFGAGVFYVLPTYPHSSTWWDLGADIYYSSVSEEETDTENTRFEDETKVFVFALRGNGLFNYHPGRMAVYFIAGAGIVMANVSWEETITYDPSHYPGINPEHWSDDVFAFGNVLNLGAGLTFSGGLETRLETPLLIFYSTPGHGDRTASTVAPTFTLSILYRFP